MVAVIDALVAGACVTLLLHLAGGLGLPLSIAIGAALAIGLLVAFHQYQKLRIAELDRLAREATGDQG